MDSAPLVVQITDTSRVSRRVLLDRIARHGSRCVVQLRDPHLSARALLAWGMELRQHTHAVGARLVVNDRLDIARVLGADGVHLGRTSVSVRSARAFMGSCWVSCSAHSVEEARCRAAEGADAVLLSPVFETPQKGPPLGVEAIAAARTEWPPGVSLIALGGLDAQRAAQALARGADGVASIRADLSAIALSPAG